MGRLSRAMTESFSPYQITPLLSPGGDCLNQMLSTTGWPGMNSLASSATVPSAASLVPRRALSRTLGTSGRMTMFFVLPLSSSGITVVTPVVLSWLLVHDPNAATHARIAIALRIAARFYGMPGTKNVSSRGEREPLVSHAIGACRLNRQILPPRKDSNSCDPVFCVFLVCLCFPAF